MPTLYTGEAYTPTHRQLYGSHSNMISHLALCIVQMRVYCNPLRSSYTETLVID